MAKIKRKAKNSKIGYWTITGLSVGLLFGVMQGNAALGMGIGTAVGIIIDLYADGTKGGKKK